MSGKTIVTTRLADLMLVREKSRSEWYTLDTLMMETSHLGVLPQGAR
jgi:hypothetical protein